MPKRPDDATSDSATQAPNLHTRAEAKFVADVLDMSFGRTHGDGEAVGDLGVGQSLRDEFCHLALAATERGGVTPAERRTTNRRRPGLDGKR